MFENDDYREALSSLSVIIDKYHFEALTGLFQAASTLVENPSYVDVAVFGQFNAGKSSLLNSLLDKPLLPVGILPLTSVITCLHYGETEKITIRTKDKRAFNILSVELEQYITEKLNPGNSKNVEQVIIESPLLMEYTNLRLIDTPGIGSLYRHNSETSQNWMPSAGLAVYVVSADRPLAGNDLEILADIRKYCSRIILVITKTDLFDKAQVKEIREFISSSVENQFNEALEIFEYSSVSETETFRRKFLSEVLNVINRNTGHELRSSFKRKFFTLVKQSLGYLNIARNALLKSESERKILLDYITREAGNVQFIYKELMLVSQMYINRNRDDIFKSLEKFAGPLTRTTESEFLKFYDSCQGNLYKISRKYEAFLNDWLKAQLQTVLINNPEIISDPVKKAGDHLLNFTRSFRNKLFNKLYESLGMSQEDAPSITINDFTIVPDINISRAFDSHIDLLWFLIPMKIFRKYFRNYFKRQIPGEIDKNIQRLTSDLTAKINQRIVDIREEVLGQMMKEIHTLENSLRADRSGGEELDQYISTLEQYQNI